MVGNYHSAAVAIADGNLTTRATAAGCLPRHYRERRCAHQLLEHQVPFQLLAAGDFADEANVVGNPNTRGLGRGAPHRHTELLT